MRTRPFTVCRSATLVSLATAFFISAVQAADPLWTNWGVITEAPQIDAINFENRGTMNIITEIAFETSNTQNYTNSGVMIGSPGWRFANLAENIGYPQPSDNFVNIDGGLIQSRDPFALTGVVGGGVIGVTLGGSYLWVDATNIVNVNNSRLSVGANGWMRLRGEQVNLNRGALEVASLTALGSSVQGTNFSPDAGIYDLYWAITNQPNPPGFATAPIWNGRIATSPVHDVGVPRQYGPIIDARTIISIVPTHADSIDITNFTVRVGITNIIGLTNPPAPGETISNVPLSSLTNYFIEVPTNITRQAAFVSVSDPSVMMVDFEWMRSSIFTNYYYTPYVRIATISSNVISAAPELNELYLWDALASSPVRALLRNANSLLNLDTYRPTNYNLSRLQQMGGGTAGAGWPAPDFLYVPGFFSNNVVTMDYAGYGAFINNRSTDVPAIPAGTATNLAGRVQVYADSLDLRRTRIRGEGQVILNTQHLIGSSNAIIDSEHLSFNLTSTNESLRIVNLAKEQVARVRGNLLMWSGAWNNDAVWTSENYVISTNFDTNTPPVPIDINITRADVTNNAVYNLHVLILDGDGLRATLPVTVWDLINHSDNVIIDDRMNLVQTFEIDATNFTLNGAITLTNASLESWLGTTFFTSLTDFVWTNVPNLMRFTNNGTLNVPSTVHFGDDRPMPGNPNQNLPLDIWVNRGTINTPSLQVDSRYFQNRGTLAITGPMTLEGVDGSLENGNSTSVQTRIAANNLRLNNYTLQARTLTLETPGLLTDAGLGTSNSIVVTRGFHLLTKPGLGDLLGTTIRTMLPNFAQIDHTWAGDDRGASASGYQNNAAVGSLVIGTSALTPLDPLAFFKGTGPGRALYVDYLDIAALGENWESWLEIDPTLTIYYATVRVGFTPPNLPNGIPQTPEEFLNGKFGGRLRWVQEYAGGRSSVAILVDGVTRFMNAGLRNSRVIDSDNDGIPNYFDTTPLGGSTPSNVSGVTLKPSLVNPNLINNTKAFSMSWVATPNTVYQIEVATDLLAGDWQPLTLYTNKLSTDQPASFTDTKSSTVKQRFYRVRVKQ